jgi:hypothetical protein
MRLAFSAIAFGFAVSGMHYTAMYGMTFVPVAAAAHPAGGLVASPQVLALVLALLCFLIAAGFLLSLVPEPRRRAAPATAGGIGDYFVPDAGDLDATDLPRPAPALRLPVEGANGTHFIDIAEIRSVRADAHYTLVHDGMRERMCPWSISQAEAQLDPAFFVRVHRSHIVSIPHVTFIRKEGDGAVVELDGATPHVVPVSRAKIAELKARLGLTGRKAHTH